MSPNLNNLNGYEKDILLGWFMFHLSQEERRALMAEFPQVYNHYAGRPVVNVVFADDPASAPQPRKAEE